MSVLEIRLVEDCFNRSQIREFVLDHPVDVASVRRLGEFGELELHSEFPRPFFRIRLALPGGGACRLKGVVGSDRFKGVFDDAPGDEDLARLRAILDARF